MTTDSLVFQAETQLPTQFGKFRFRIYKNTANEDVIAIVTQRLNLSEAVAVRVHSACFTAEVMSSLKCDCKQQLDFALKYIAEHGGLVIYLPQEGRGIGLSNKIRAYALQENGHDTIAANKLLGLPVDSREYSDAAAVLHDLNIHNLKLITNNPEKLTAMRELGFSVQRRVPVPVISNHHSQHYLETKRTHMGHMLEASISSVDEITQSRRKSRRPFVHVNFAISPQGLMNQKDGKPIALSCDEDWRRVHQLRERYSAVVVGARTWILDQPRLSARLERLGRVPRRQPDRVIFAGHTPCKLTLDERRSFVIGTAENTAHNGIHINADSRDLATPLQALYDARVDSLLVEGGMTLLKSFIQQEMIDQLSIYVSTPSLEQAVCALSDLFPELPVTVMRTAVLGKGTLFSHRFEPTKTKQFVGEEHALIRSSAL